jgi:ribosomal protein S24E
MKVLRDFRNDLLKRREIKLVVNAGKNPGFAEAAKMLSEKFKVEDATIVVKELKSKFGRDTFLIDAMIYDSANDKERVELKKRVKKKEGEAAGAAK